MTPVGDDQTGVPTSHQLIDVEAAGTRPQRRSHVAVAGVLPTPPKRTVCQVDRRNGPIAGGTNQNAFVVGAHRPGDATDRIGPNVAGFNGDQGLRPKDRSVLWRKAKQIDVAAHFRHDIETTVDGQRHPKEKRVFQR